MIHDSGLHCHKQKTFVSQPAEMTGVILKDDSLLAPRAEDQRTIPCESNIRNRRANSSY